MADTLALEYLYTQVVAQFATDATFGTTPDAVTAARAANTFGWREPQRQGGPPARVIWTPGDLGGRVGDYDGPRYPGSLPARPIAKLWELFTVRLVYFDAAHAENELLQWKGARLLYDAWIRAVYLVAHGNFEIRESSWDREHNERRAGACIQCVGAILSVIPDADADLAPTDTGGNITVTELDATSHVIVTETP